MITLVTGGARSGKSQFAESCLESKKDVVYIATSRVKDREMEERIALHKNSRPNMWRTFEGNYDIWKAVGDEKYYLLDCITVLTSNIMFDISKDMDYIDYDVQEKIENQVIEEIEILVEKIKLNNANLIIVTNEVGSGLVPEYHLSRVFRDIQGRINQRLGQISDRVYWVVSGIPVRIK